MIQLNNLTEVNTEMTELTDLQTSSIKGGKVNQKIINDFYKAAKGTGGGLNADEERTLINLTKAGLQG